MNNNTPLKQVLFVDDSPKFLEKLRKTMPTWSHGKWDMLTSPGTTEAFQTLDTEHVDLVVVDDFRMSGMNGLQFLKLAKQKHPHIRRALLSAYLDQGLRTECLHSGADMYLVKPKRSNGFETIFHSLNQLFEISTEGFRGLLRKVSLTDLIQLECLSKRSSVLEISAGIQFGQVFIKRGCIIHAQAGSKTGVEAFIRLMRMPGGDFHLKAFFEPTAQTIDMSCDRLLLDASYAIDSVTEPFTNGDSLHLNNTDWFRKGSRHSDSSLLNETPASLSINNFSADFLVTESATSQGEPDSSQHHNGNSSKSISHTIQIDASGLDTVMKLTDELISNRAQLDMKILDMALLKEELNGCKSRLVEVIEQLHERVANPHQVHPVCPSDKDNATFNPVKSDFQNGDPLNLVIDRLNIVSDETSAIVSQLDGFFSTFTEESSQFNDTSTKLQDEVARLHNTFSVQ